MGRAGWAGRRAQGGHHRRRGELGYLPLSMGYSSALRRSMRALYSMAACRWALAVLSSLSSGDLGRRLDLQESSGRRHSEGIWSQQQGPAEKMCTLHHSGNKQRRWRLVGLSRERLAESGCSRLVSSPIVCRPAVASGDWEAGKLGREGANGHRPVPLRGAPWGSLEQYTVHFTRKTPLSHAQATSRHAHETLVPQSNACRGARQRPTATRSVASGPPVPVPQARGEAI